MDKARPSREVSPTEWLSDRRLWFRAKEVTFLTVEGEEEARMTESEPDVNGRRESQRGGGQRESVGVRGTY